MQDTTTRVPAVVDALIAAFTEALPNAQVVDGPRTAQELADDVVIVGQFSDAGSVRSTQVRQQGLGSRPQETFTVQCVLSSWSGTPGMRARRVRAGEMLAAVDTALRADMTLGGVADNVTLGENIEWLQDQTNSGPVCEVAFEVTGRAWL